MPTYNQVAYLRKVLDSVLAQTFKDFESIVVNDGSTDNTQEILDGYSKKDRRIKIKRQPNRGISRAFNRGYLSGKG